MDKATTLAFYLLSLLVVVVAAIGIYQVFWRD